MPPPIARKAIQADILTKLAGIDGVENVYDSPQRIQDYEEFITKAVEAEKEFCQIWQIRRISSIANQSSNRHNTGCDASYTHGFVITLWWGFISGESEEHFQDLVDAVLYALIDDRTWGQNAFGSLAPISLQSINDESYVGITGTKATFNLDIMEVFPVTYT